MAGPFVADVSADRGFESGFGGVRREERADIGFFASKQAVAELAVGGEAQRLQLRQKGLLTEAMKPTRSPFAKRYSVAGARGSASGTGSERAELGRMREHFIGGQDLAAGPDFLRIERHELDEADFDLALAGEADERDEVGLRDAFDGDGIQLDLLKPAARRGFDAGEHARKIVAAGDRWKRARSSVSRWMFRRRSPAA